MILFKAIRKYKSELGLCISILGVTWGMYLNYLYRISIGWSPLMMFLSIFLLTNWKYFFELKFPKLESFQKKILFFQIFLIIYWLFSDNAPLQYLTFQLYVICFVFSLSTNERIDTKTFFKFFLFLSSITSLVALYFFNRGLVVGEDAYLMRQEDSDYAIETFTVIWACTQNALAILCYPVKNRILNLFLIALFVLDIYLMILSNKRTPLFFLVLSILAIMYVKGNVLQKLLKVFSLKWLLFIIIIFFILSLIPDFFDRLVHLYDYFCEGVKTLFGSTNDIYDKEASASIRTINRNRCLNDIQYEFDFFNYIFGAGYLKYYIDAPIIEAYADFGIIGFVCFFYIIIYYPIKILFKKIDYSILLFAVTNCLYAIGSIISAGNVCAYRIYIMVCILAYFVLQYKQLKRI